LAFASGFMESLEGLVAKKFKKPRIFQGGKCVVNFLVCWWWMERNGTQN